MPSVELTIDTDSKVLRTSMGDEPVKIWLGDDFRALTIAVACGYTAAGEILMPPIEIRVTTAATEAEAADMVANKMEGVPYTPGKIGLTAIHMTHPTRPAKTFVGLIYSNTLCVETSSDEIRASILAAQLRRYERFLAAQDAAAKPRRAGRR